MVKPCDVFMTQLLQVIKLCSLSGHDTEYNKQDMVNKILLSFKKQ